MTAYLQLTKAAVLTMIRQEARGCVSSTDMPALEKYCLERISNALLQNDLPDEIRYFVEEFIESGL